MATSQLDKDGFNILKGTGKKCNLFEDNGIFGHSDVTTSKHLSEYLRRKFTNRAWTDIILRTGIYNSVLLGVQLMKEVRNVEFVKELYMQLQTMRVKVHDMNMLL